MKPDDATEVELRRLRQAEDMKRLAARQLDDAIDNIQSAIVSLDSAGEKLLRLNVSCRYFQRAVRLRMELKRLEEGVEQLRSPTVRLRRIEERGVVVREHRRSKKKQ